MYLLQSEPNPNRTRTSKTDTNPGSNCIWEHVQYFTIPVVYSYITNVQVQSWTLIVVKKFVYGGAPKARKIKATADEFVQRCIKVCLTIANCNTAYRTSMYE